MRPSGRICPERTAKRAQARRLSRFVIFMPSHAGHAKNNMAAPCVFSRRSVSRLHPPRFAEKLGISPESAHRSGPFGRSAATDIYSARHEERRADRKTPALHCMTSSRMRRAHPFCAVCNRRSRLAAPALSMPYATEAAECAAHPFCAVCNRRSWIAAPTLPAPHATDAVECAAPALSVPYATDAASSPHPLSVPYATDAAECATLPCLCHM